MRKILGVVLLSLAASLVVPVAASAATTHKKAPAVTYQLTGTLSGYSAATSSSTGSVTILVAHSNYQGKTLKGQTLTFTLSNATKVVLHDHKAIADGDNGIVKVRSAKGASASTLEAATPTAVIDKGAKTTHKKAPAVTYQLTGTLSGYNAATSTTTGSVTILVKHSNYQAKTLKGQSLTFTISKTTRVVLHDHKAIADGDNGIVKVRSTKGASAMTIESATPTAVIDKGAKAKKH